jgi:hypothetical protein
MQVSIKQQTYPIKLQQYKPRKKKQDISTNQHIKRNFKDPNKEIEASSEENSNSRCINSSRKRSFRVELPDFQALKSRI